MERALARRDAATKITANSVSAQLNVPKTSPTVRPSMLSVMTPRLSRRSDARRAATTSGESGSRSRRFSARSTRIDERSTFWRRSGNVVMRAPACDSRIGTMT
jgi:hypothetical protein